MYRPLLAVALLCSTATFAMAHCQVPCGIYGDPASFRADCWKTSTRSPKLSLQLAELTGGDADAQAVNQMARWVMTKEEHATKIQNTISAYFLAQRIKPDNPKYMDQLVAAHKVIIAAMKCKQSADPATAEVLEKAIFALYKAYEGKEPDFKHEH